MMHSPTASHIAPRAPQLSPRAGLGLKAEHFKDILETWPNVGFFEVHAENYMVAGGPFHHYLSLIRAHYPLSIHGVGLSIGCEGVLDQAHLLRLRTLLDRYEPEQFSEHLAWSTHGQWFLNDLLPLRYDDATLTRVCEHIDHVQNVLRRPMLLENPATYVEFDQADYDEAAFIHHVIQRTGCGLLLDVNNVYVSCINHRRDPIAYIDALPLQAVGELHLAGFAEDTDSQGQRLLIDNHGAAVDSAVWDLYWQVVKRIGPMATLIERDNHVPALSELLIEAQRADHLIQTSKVRV